MARDVYACRYVCGAMVNRLWVSSRWDGRRRLIKWNAYSHEWLKPRALYKWHRRRRSTMGFQEALYYGMLTRLLNKETA